MKSIGAHPGVSNTNLTAAGNDLGSSFFSTLSKPFLKLSDLLLAQDAEHGALPTLYAATKDDLAGGTYIGPDGLGEMRGSPTIVAPRKVAHNVEVADQLWNEVREADRRRLRLQRLSAALMLRLELLPESATA